MQIILVTGEFLPSEERVAALLSVREQRGCHVPKVADEEDLAGLGIDFPKQRLHGRSRPALLGEVLDGRLCQRLRDLSVEGVDPSLYDADQLVYVPAAEPFLDRGIQRLLTWRCEVTPHPPVHPAHLRVQELLIATRLGQHVK